MIRLQDGQRSSGSRRSRGARAVSSRRRSVFTPAVSVVGDGESFNYGIGASAFYGANGVRADWTRNEFADSGGEADSWPVSYVHRF